MANAGALSILVPTLVTLDGIAQRGAGRMAVIPRAVNTVSASEHKGWQFVAWPKGNFDAIVLAASQLGFFGDPIVSPANAQVAALIDNGSNLQLAFVKGSASTVDDIRMKLRRQLEALGVQLAPAPSTPKTPSKFPWAWVLGAMAMGTGLGLLLFFAEKQHALPGDSDE